MADFFTYRGYRLATCERLYYGKPVWHTWVTNEATGEPVIGMRKWYATPEEAQHAIDQRVATIEWRRKKMLALAGE